MNTNEVSVQRKPKTQRSKKALADRRPKVNENPKTALFIKGRKTSNIVSGVLTDLYLLKKPYCVKFERKNDVEPFTDASSLEFFSQKNDASLFLLASHSKKRPHNIVMGRTYDYHILDMVEFAVTNYKPISDFKNAKNMSGSKPCFIFSGDEWHNNPEKARVQNMFLDFFRGEFKMSKISLAGMDHVCVCTAVGDKIHFRHYAMSHKYSTEPTDGLAMVEVGPRIDLQVRRTRLASEDLIKQASKLSQVITGKKRKNLDTTVTGDKTGNIHLKKQNLNKLATKKTKALPKHKKVAKAPSVNNGDRKSVV